MSREHVGVRKMFFIFVYLILFGEANNIFHNNLDLLLYVQLLLAAPG
jgi:hypothetical protein